MLSWSFTSSSLTSSPKRRVEALLRDAVDFPQQQKAIGRRKVPPKLCLLAHDEGDLSPQVVVPLPRPIPQHACVAASREDDPREHLDERRLARAVGPDKADDLPLADSEANLAHRGLLDFLALE